MTPIVLNFTRPVDPATVLGDGTRAPSPLLLTQGGNPVPGQILVRPDALLLTPAGETLPTDAARGSIVEVADTGTLVNVRVELGDRTLEVQDLSRRGWRVGQVVNAALQKDGALVLPA